MWLGSVIWWVGVSGDIPRIVGGVVGIACAPIDQDITRVSCSTVVGRGG